MNLDLIAMITMLIIMSLWGIGILLCLIITWSDQCTTQEEQFYEDDEQMNYLIKFKSRKYNKSN